MDIPKIGTGECTGCGKTERLLDGACSACRRKFGMNCGPIMGKIRQSRRFALLCFSRLAGDFEREQFVEMFGDPRSPASGE